VFCECFVSAAPCVLWVNLMIGKSDGLRAKRVYKVIICTRQLLYTAVIKN